MSKIAKIIIFMIITSFSLEVFAGEYYQTWRNDIFSKTDEEYHKLKWHFLKKEIWDEEEILEEINALAEENNLPALFHNRMWRIREVVISIWEGTWNEITDLREILDFEWAIDFEIVKRYLLVIEEYYEQKDQMAEKKKKFTTAVTRIWVYFDWDEENSEFDLIADLRNIDDIIFWKSWEYNWVNKKGSSDKTLEAFLWLKEPFNPYKKVLYRNDFDWNWDSDEIKENKIDDDLKNSIDLWSVHNYACLIDNTWLDESSLDLAYWDEKKVWEDEENTINIDPILWQKSDKNKSVVDNVLSEIWQPLWASKPVYDNDLCWPGDILCITIDFEKYRWNSEGSWSYSEPTIEFIVDKSNQYLEPTFYKSLMQSEMTHKNFELDLNNIKLSDIFSSWVTLQYLPVPIINTEGQSEVYDTLDNEMSTKKWALSHLFEARWLTYENQNDLVAFLWISWDRENLFDWRWDSYTELNNKIQERKRVVQWDYEEAVKALEVANSQLTGDYWNFKDLEKQIWELEIFIESAMEEYPFILKNNIDKLPK